MESPQVVVLAGSVATQQAHQAHQAQQAQQAATTRASFTAKNATGTSSPTMRFRFTSQPRPLTRMKRMSSKLAAGYRRQRMWGKAQAMHQVLLQRLSQTQRLLDPARLQQAPGKQTCGMMCSGSTGAKASLKNKSKTFTRRFSVRSRVSEVSFPQSVADADAGPLGPVVCYKISLNTTRFARRGASYNICQSVQRLTLNHVNSNLFQVWDKVNVLEFNRRAATGGPRLASPNAPHLSVMARPFAKRNWSSGQLSTASLSARWFYTAE